MTRALLLFARSPETEARSKGLPLRSGAALFHRIAHLWSAAAKFTGARLFISTEAAGWTAVAPEAVVLRQKGPAFGIRLADSVEQTFADGITSLLVAGIDTPPPNLETLEKAFLHLEQGEPAGVIGPASDGGIYLLGLTHADRVLLEGIQPRQDNVVEYCGRFFQGSAVLLLPVASDLDSLRDALRLARKPETVWIGFHSFLTSMLGNRSLAPRVWVAFATDRKSLGPRAPPSWAP
jgi:glycosyltransferase A (GT-A) superfamily protein (DUF2064 family)